MTAVELRTRAAGENPFIGLRPFRADDADLFFGREAQVAKLLERLQNTRFLATVGSSGCGKSSLILAGLIPALERGSIERAGTCWRIATLRPGTAPIDALAAALAEPGVLGTDRDDAALQRATIRHGLERGELGLVDLVYQARLREDENLLVIVDQFEELFRYTEGAGAAPASEATAFVKLLLTAAAWTDLPIYVAITMRSDFIGDCARFRDLPEAVNDGLFLVPRMTRDEMQHAIEGPVHRAGERISPRLVSRLLNDIGSDSDQLPVLQHAMMRTWNEWKKHHAPGEPLDVAQYEAIGEMSGALSKHANDIYDELDPRLQLVAERLFRCLTTRDSENRGVRRPTTFGTVREITEAHPGDVERLLRIYAAPGVSFLTASGPPSNDRAVLDISHESLMRLWDRLARWVNEEAESGETYRKLVEDATMKRAYWINPELAVGEAWRKNNRDTINAAWGSRYDEGLKKLSGDETVRRAAARGRFDAALAFLAASAAAPKRRLRTIALAVGAFFIIAAALAVLAAVQRSNALAADEHAKQERVAAIAAQNVAEQERKRANESNLAAQQERLRATEAQKKERQLAQQVRADAARSALFKQEARRQLKAAHHEAVRTSALANYNGGLVFFARNDWGGAIPRFDKAIQQLGKGIGTPADLANAYDARAQAYARQGKFERALADYDRALALKPNDPDFTRGRQLTVALQRGAANGAVRGPIARAPAVRAPAPARRADRASTTASRDRAARAVPTGSGTAGEACGLALNYEKTAANDAVSRQDAYDAAVAGLSTNAGCGDRPTRVVNEAYLLSMRAPAEAQLRIGNWRADLQRADQRLRECTTMPELRNTPAAANCRAQLANNERVRRQLAAFRTPAAR